jgi:hypothetical protein
LYRWKADAIVICPPEGGSKRLTAVNHLTVVNPHIPY